MHHLQTKIIYALALQKCMKFSELKPKEMESNQFMYHLKSVISSGLVAKVDDKYELTPKGIQYVNRMSFEQLATRLQPVLKTMIYAEDKAGKQLLYKIRRQPLIDKVGLVNGKIHYGETIQAAAERELLEKSGLSAKLTYRGNVNVRAYKQDELVGHVCEFIYEATDITGELKQRGGPHGESYWGELTKLAKEDCMPEIFQVIDLIKEDSKKLFFADIRADI